MVTPTHPTSPLPHINKDAIIAEYQKVVEHMKHNAERDELTIRHYKRAMLSMLLTFGPRVNMRIDNFERVFDGSRIEVRHGFEGDTLVAEYFLELEDKTKLKQEI